ncbi:hypothetical protein HYU11_01525 [Candidatus Woesearchaeota archaeon]|nr:hypothetical protein [Candidatus Woesearchaeota archaeon]
MTSIAIENLIKPALYIFAGIILLVIARGLTEPTLKGIVETVSEMFDFGEKCEEGYFKCQKARMEDGKWVPECIRWGKSGIKDENCDPRHYKPVNFRKGEYDICRENCIIDYCPAGTGRKGNECKSCQNEGENCGGGYPIIGGNAGECCAPEYIECKGGFLGSSGKCQRKVVT